VRCATVPVAVAGPPGPGRASSWARVLESYPSLPAQQPAKRACQCGPGGGWQGVRKGAASAAGGPRPGTAQAWQPECPRFSKNFGSNGSDGSPSPDHRANASEALLPPNYALGSGCRGLRLDNNHFAYTPIVATVTRKRAAKLGRTAAALLAVFEAVSTAGAAVVTLAVSARSPLVICATKQEQCTARG
jgi:hypothetical protein